MSTNITLRLDEKLVRRIKHLAVDQQTSVSAWVGELVTRAVEGARQLRTRPQDGTGRHGSSLRRQRRSTQSRASA